MSCIAEHKKHCITINFAVDARRSVNIRKSQYHQLKVTVVVNGRQTYKHTHTVTQSEKQTYKTRNTETEVQINSKNIHRRE